MADYLQDDYLTNRTISRPVLVAVKMLRKDADDRARYSNVLEYEPQRENLFSGFPTRSDTN